MAGGSLTLGFKSKKQMKTRRKAKTAGQVVRKVVQAMAEKKMTNTSYNITYLGPNIKPYYSSGTVYEGLPMSIHVEPGDAQYQRDGDAIRVIGNILDWTVYVTSPPQATVDPNIANIRVRIMVFRVSEYPSSPFNALVEDTSGTGTHNFTFDCNVNPQMQKLVIDKRYILNSENRYTVKGRKYLKMSSKARFNEATDLQPKYPKYYAVMAVEEQTINTLPAAGTVVTIFNVGTKFIDL